MLLWLAHVLLAVGSIALVLLSTVWVVPMALVSRDPRVVGIALVFVGLVMTGVGLLRLSRKPRRWRGRVVSVLALVVVSIGTVAWAFAASPYDLEHVAFAHAPASLAGTVVLPRGAGPHPAVVFVHGSGPARRGEFFHFADRFARAGIAALIYDKRGSGASVGGHPRDAYADLAELEVSAHSPRTDLKVGATRR